ncbi:ABC transporter substrate-binding protein [Desulfotalea psychrophila]|uniref:Probable amino acid ABC transporter, periplasmic substrate-binding protein n=1 Tax=Desulfotalea psychrophila (strain LSv54 / DSM 12343) TaxID=177439 RepID=Q6AMY6_DESPS|nr:ABC transporter substrate-binding protein [Desulfotalea psychrophila]CAG36288.1 probable amino acid ABC transporter, periplasmic substrate-binding protein [Desulfotalea psychrophila LSv54]
MKNSKKQKFCFGFIVLSLFLLTGISAQADSSLQQVVDSGEIRVGFCAQYPPFESVNVKTGEFEGFDIALAKAIADEMGVAAVLIDAEWQGLLGGLKKGDYDVLITCMAKSESRRDNTNFSDVYYTLPDVIVVRQDDTIVKDKDDLSGKVIGVQLGSGSEQLADSMEGRLKEIKRYNYNPEAFTDLKAKRIDAVFVGYAYAVNHMKSDSAYKIVDEPLAKADIVAVLDKGADALTQKINESLAKLKANGKYQKIVNQWLTVQ